jgi:hypothetical protein
MPLEKALGKNSFLDSLLSSCPLTNDTKRILVDARVQHFDCVKATERVGWHVDFRLSDPTPESYEINHLWASSNPTMFSLDENLEADIKTIKDIKEKIVPNIKQVIQGDKYCWYTYDRTRLHKGPLVTENGSRFFVRVSETMERY